MKELPVNDLASKNGHIRQDGRLVRDMVLVKVKAPSESKSKYDWFDVVASIPGDRAFRPIAEGGCPLVK